MLGMSILPSWTAHVRACCHLGASTLYICCPSEMFNAPIYHTYCIHYTLYKRPCHTQIHKVHWLRTQYITLSSTTTGCIARAQTVCDRCNCKLLTSAHLFVSVCTTIANNTCLCNVAEMTPVCKQAYCHDRGQQHNVLLCKISGEIMQFEDIRHYLFRKCCSMSQLCANCSVQQHSDLNDHYTLSLFTAVMKLCKTLGCTKNTTLLFAP